MSAVSRASLVVLSRRPIGATTRVSPCLCCRMSMQRFFLPRPGVSRAGRQLARRTRCRHPSFPARNASGKHQPVSVRTPLYATRSTRRVVKWTPRPPGCLASSGAVVSGAGSDSGSNAGPSSTTVTSRMPCRSSKVTPTCAPGRSAHPWPVMLESTSSRATCNSQTLLPAESACRAESVERLDCQANPLAGACDTDGLSHAASCVTPSTSS